MHVNVCVCVCVCVCVYVCVLCIICAHFATPFARRCMY